MAVVERASEHAILLRRLPRRRRATTDAPLWKASEVEHRVLRLFLLWRDRRDTDRPTLLGYWGHPTCN